MSEALTGSNWGSRLKFFAYDAEGNVELSSECRNLRDVLNHFVNPNPAFMKITSIRSYATPLQTDDVIRTCCPWLYSIFKGSLKHHFLDLSLASGDFVSIEKTIEAIVIQKSPKPLTSTTIPSPIVRFQAEGQDRVQNTSSIKLIEADDHPKNFDIIDVIEWIDAQGLLQEPYHVSDSNCQHFAGVIWAQLSEQPYPYPSQFNGQRPYVPIGQRGTVEEAGIMTVFWAAAPKETKSCRTQGDFCSFVYSFAHSFVCPPRPSQA